MKTTIILELAMALIMLILLIGILYRTIKHEKGIGARVIQFLCIGFLIPTIIILAIENILGSETVGTLLGGIAGYVLSGISNYDSKKSDDTKKTQTPS